MAAKASCPANAGSSLPSRRTKRLVQGGGASGRRHAWRVLSLAHSSFTSSLMRGTRAQHLHGPRLSRRMLVPTASITSMAWRVLQFPRPRHRRHRLAEVSAPTGQRSTTLPDELACDSAFKIAGDLHILAATDRADFLDPRDFFGKADAARALDAACHHRLDDRAHIFFGHRALVLVIARTRRGHKRCSGPARSHSPP